MKVFYFSGTGNSLSVAKQIGEENITNIARCKENSFKDESIGFIFPVYCSDIPEIVREFIEKSEFDSDYIWAIGTCGMNVGKSFVTINTLLQKQNRKLSYCKRINLPNSCILMKSSLKKQGEMLKNQTNIVDKIKKDISEKTKNKVFSDLPVDVSKASWFGLKTIFGAKNKKVNDKCTKCGICEKLCPTDNIKLEEKPVFGNRCIYCFGCIQWCPAGAIEFGKLKSNDKSEYTHPAITVTEMIKMNEK